MFGKVEDNNDSYYTSEQIALLMAVDPDFQDKYEKEQDLKNQIDYEKLKEKSDAFDQRMPLDGSAINMMDLKNNMEDYEGEGIRAPNGSGVCAPNGGALPAILPIAAKIVAPLAVKGIFKGIKWLVKKIKNKKNKNNIPQTGSGICAPNGGAIHKKVLEYLNRNRPQFERFNNDLMRMNGKQAWKHILKYGKNITKDILSDYTKDPEMNKKIKRSFNKFVPYKFKKMIKLNNKPLGDNGRLSNISLASPVIKYGITVIAGSGPISRKAYNMSKKHIMNNYGYYGNGKLSWQKVKKLVKKGLSKGLTYLKGFGDRFINGDNVKNAISNILKNFEILESLGIDPDTIGDMGQKLVKKGYDKGYDKVKEKLDNEDYSDIDKDISDAKNKIDKFKSISSKLTNNSISQNDNISGSESKPSHSGFTLGYGKTRKN